MNPSTKTIRAAKHVALRLTATGLVQGIGMRPAVARFAQRLLLVGYVGNTLDGVEVHVEGLEADVDRFETELRFHLPIQAEVETYQSESVKLLGFESFTVRSTGFSRKPGASPPAGGTTNGCQRQLTARIPTDVVVCAECLAEVQDPNNRRHNYPFTSCTHCGPRYSIIERMPFERADTSMKAFKLCELCQSEYESPADRRFHAQTNACPDCGPQIWLRDASDRIVARHQDAIQTAADTILPGGIVALRGLGGYQLLVDATSQSAVEKLRKRKRRPGKPLAVMVASLDEAKNLVRLDAIETQLLSSPSGPIVIVRACAESGLADSIATGLNTVGVMLPTTPLHWLLLDAVRRPLVCTSGNIDGEPLACDADVAFGKLRNVADVWLEHDRPIQRPVDDSVIRVIAGRPVGIRLGRGFAPLSLNLKTKVVMISAGGHQKTSLAISNGRQAILGPHIGDMDTIAARERFLEQADDLSSLYGVETSQRVCDQHPDYFTTTWADQQTDDPGKTTVRIQHHHAHIAAGMLEHGWLDREVFGVAFDGTGYGSDETIWGGEFLLTSSTGYKRIGHLRPFPLIGGETAIRQPWRVAMALVHDAVGAERALQLPFLNGDAAMVLPLLGKPALSPTTTSAGRLFDGIAAIVLGAGQCQFEGQAAMLLESACDLTAFGEYAFVVEDTEPKQLDWRPVVKKVLSDQEAGAAPGTIAMRFHRGLAHAIIEFCSGHSELPVVFGGGVFQNRVMVELLADGFAETNQTIGLPGLIPPNDGGLAAGQLAIAAALSEQRRTNSCV